MRLVFIALVFTLRGFALPAQIHVDPMGSDLGLGTAASPFLTINHAASVAPPGSTIYLHAGTYGDEQGIVTLGGKDLVLQGEGMSSTILHPHSTLTASLLPAAPGAVNPEDHRVGILLAGTASVHLRDLTIDAGAFAPPSGNLAGLYLSGGVEVVCDRLAIRGCRSTTPGTGTAAACVVRGDVPTDPTTLEVRMGSFTGYGDVGVTASLRAEVELFECELAGLGGGSVGFDQVGVLVESDAFASVRASRISDCGGPDGAAVRMRNHTTDCVLEGNRVSRVTFGFDLEQVPPSIVPASIRGNRISDVETAIRIRGESGVAIEGNSLFAVSHSDPVPCDDDTAAGNAWQGNRYAVSPAIGAVAIPGGGNVDASPGAGISELGDLQRVPCGGAPVAVAVADFDGDGHDDFATLDLLGAGVGLSVGLWRPSGHLVISQPFGGPGLQPVALLAGEFDGQLGVDLVALTAPLPPAGVGSAFWVFANDGSGAVNLAHQENLPGYVMPAAIASASFNANAVDDLIVGDRGAFPLTPGQAHTFLNDGTGTQWFATPVPVAFSEAVTAVATGDLDGDGKVDIALAEGGPSSGRVHWLFGTGVGFFVSAAGSPLPTAQNPTAVAIVDHDADGDRDLLVGALGGALPFQRGALQVFANDGGALQPGPVWPTDHGPTRLVGVDLDGDTFLGDVRPELLVLDTAAGVISLLGAHTEATGFAGGGLCTSVDGPVDIATTDLDGDAFRDLVVAEPSHSGVALLRGLPTARVTTFGRGCPGTRGHEPRLVTAGVSGMPTQPNPGLRIALVDGLPSSLAVFALSIVPAPTLTPCGYLLDFTYATWVTVTDSSGRVAIDLPLPAVPLLHGLPMCLQAGVLDPGATNSFYPGVSLTAGLRLRLGD